MAKIYASTLIAQKISFAVICRKKTSALSFKNKIDVDVNIGGLSYNLKKYKAPEIAIVAVGVDQLFKVTTDLLIAGTKRILIEKPGGINLKEIQLINKLAIKKNAQLFVAYNRRFYQSVTYLRKCLKKDGGPISLHFEFTEWQNKIKSSSSNAKVKRHWLTANSSHVIDLAFHLCGKPDKWKYYKKGKLKWHPNAARFCGSGITKKGTLFSYLADWEGPGRWGLEILTKKNRYILRPMEELQVIKLNKTKIQKVSIPNKIDKKFKPGIFLQVKNFIKKNNSFFCEISEQLKNMKIFYKIAGYK